jgi:hypothetical protein
MLLEGDSHDDDRADIRSTDKPGERRTPLRPVPGEPGGACPVGYVGKMGITVAASGNSVIGKAHWTAGGCGNSLGEAARHRSQATASDGQTGRRSGRPAAACTRIGRTRNEGGDAENFRFSTGAPAVGWRRDRGR